MPPVTRKQLVREAVATGVSPDTIVSDKQQQINVRLRQESSKQFSPANNDAASTTSSHRSKAPDEPPRFSIDLSLPPEQRYLEVCTAFKSEMLNLTSLFDEVVGGMITTIPTNWLRLICKTLLRRVYSEEETAELKGISKASGVDMYLLVCFNILLDLFMGCSSGGAVVRSGADMASGSKMVHFRTLDWSMPALRRIIIHLDFVAEKDGPIIASSITYTGFVGVLTGVRKDLSLSLNFRPNRMYNGNFWSDVKYGWHLAMVLLGRRPSISSHLRQFLLPKRREESIFPELLSTTKGETTTLLTYADIVEQIVGESGGSKPMTTTACYLCLCNGEETTTIEKDLVSAMIRPSPEFIVVTNSDDASTTATSDTKGKKSPQVVDACLQELIEEAKDRQHCALMNWARMRTAKSKRLGIYIISNDDLKTLSEVNDIIELVQRYPTTNECTHFAAVLDPKEGNVAWCRRWMKPVSAKWIREHMSEV